MRRTVTISVSEEMFSLIHRGMKRHACSTVSEYIRLLVRKDHGDAPMESRQVEYRPLRKANDAFKALRR